MREQVLDALAIVKEQFEFTPGLTAEDYESIVNAGFKTKTLPAAFILTELANNHRPITVRGLMYRAQAAGLFPSTDNEFYRRTGWIILRLRRAGVIPYSWIVDSTRRRLKPSSWSGLRDFASDAALAYRLDFWSRQNDYVEMFCEKDAMAGVIEPVTEEFDVHLNIIRGEVSDTFVWRIAEEWQAITKPITAYYLGDHDVFGLRIEQTVERKLREFVEQDFDWKRLAVDSQDFDDETLTGFRVKRTGARKSWQPYLETYGDRCVEVDAIEPDEIRRRVREAIESHIDHAQWKRLELVEQLEKETVTRALKRLRSSK